MSEHIDIDKAVRPHLEPANHLTTSAWVWQAYKDDNGTGLDENLPFDEFVVSVDIFNDEVKTSLAIEVNGKWYESDSSQDWGVLDRIFNRDMWQTWIYGVALDFTAHYTTGDTNIFERN